MTSSQPLGSWQELMASFDWNVHNNMGDLAIPPLLAGLTEPEQVKQAADQIQWAVFHQDMLCEQSAPVVRVVGRQLVHGALADLGTGLELLYVAVDSLLCSRDDEDFEQEIRDCTAALQDVVDEFASICDTPECRWRWAWLARLVPEVSDDCVAALEQVAAHRPVDRTVIAATTALASHGRPVAADDVQLQIATALGRIWREGTDTDDIATITADLEITKQVFGQIDDDYELTEWLGEYNPEVAAAVLVVDSAVDPQVLAETLCRTQRSDLVAKALTHVDQFPPLEALGVLKLLPATSEVLDVVDRVGRRELDEPTRLASSAQREARIRDLVARSAPQRIVDQTPGEHDEEPAVLAAEILATAKDPRWEGHLAPVIQRLGDLPNTPGAGPVQRWEGYLDKQELQRLFPDDPAPSP